MNKRERLHAAIHKQKVDRPPIALWQHFPHDDLDSEKLSRRIVKFQNAYDFDFVKVTPASSYVAEMYGGDVRHSGNREGTRENHRRVVREWQDWKTIGPIALDNPVLLRESDTIRRVRQALGKDVPILQTIFTPLSCARTLSGDRHLHDLRDHPSEFSVALQHLGTTMVRFAQASIDAGADALFLSTQVASETVVTPEELHAFGEVYDLALLNQLQGKVDFIFLHVHGEYLHYQELFKYPVQIVNWHDRKTPPTLHDGKALVNGAVAGGIEEWTTLQSTPAAITAQVRDAIAQTDGTGLIVAPGCVIPIDTPAENVVAARKAVELD